MIRRALWTFGTPLREMLIASIHVYRATLSGWLGGQCRFSPTCSQYAEDAIRSQGALRGSAVAVWRILRCNPFGRGGLDPAPLSRAPGSEKPRRYETIIPSGDAGS